MLKKVRTTQKLAIKSTKENHRKHTSSKFKNTLWYTRLLSVTLRIWESRYHIVLHCSRLSGLLLLSLFCTLTFLLLPCDLNERTTLLCTFCHFVCLCLILSERLSISFDFSNRTVANKYIVTFTLFLLFSNPCT